MKSGAINSKTFFNFDRWIKRKIKELGEFTPRIQLFDVGGFSKNHYRLFMHHRLAYWKYSFQLDQLTCTYDIAPVGLNSSLRLDWKLFREKLYDLYVVCLYIYFTLLSRDGLSNRPSYYLKVKKSPFNVWLITELAYRAPTNSPGFFKRKVSENQFIYLHIKQMEIASRFIVRLFIWLRTSLSFKPNLHLHMVIRRKVWIRVRHAAKTTTTVDRGTKFCEWKKMSNDDDNTCVLDVKYLGF